MNKMTLLAATTTIGLTASAAVLTPETTQVVVPKDAPAIVKFAGAELTNYLSKVFGSAIPLVSQPTNGKVAILLGEKALADTGVSLAGEDPETFVRKTTGNRIVIGGHDNPHFDLPGLIARGEGHGSLLSVDRATLFGVYDFLEQVAGCRFYFVGDLGEIVPQAKQLTVAEGVRKVAPNFMIREPYFGSHARWMGEETSTRGRITSLTWLRQRLSSRGIPCCHGSRNFKYIDRFAKTRPDFMALKQNGTRWLDPKVFAAYQYCWANPDFQEEFYKDIKGYLTGAKPETRGLKSWGPGCKGRYVDVMPEDSFEGCYCERCQKAYTHRPGDRHYATELMWGLVGKWGQRLIDEGIDGRLTMMSYPPYGRIPEFSLPPNIDVMVATGGPWSLVNAKMSAEADKIVRDWAKKLGHRVWVWTYPHKWGATAIPGLPSFGPRAWGRYFHGMQDAIFGSFAESETENAFYNHLNYYVFSRVGWDASCDPDAVVDEYYRLMFGVAEPEMKEFFETLETKWTHEIVGNIEQTKIGPVAAPPTAEVLWTKVFSPAVRAQLAALLAKGREKAGASSIVARRIDLMKVEFLDGLEGAAKIWEDEMKTTRSFVYDASSVEPLKTCVVAEGGDKVSFKPSVQTEIRIRKTASAFVIDFDCEEPKMADILAPARQADDVNCWRDNGVEALMNVSDDGKTVYHFILTSNGSFVDGIDTRVGARGTSDWSWNSGATHSVARTARGWSAHLEVPLASLPWLREKFRANFCRNRVINGLTEFSMTSRYAKGYGNFEKYGWLIVK